MDISVREITSEDVEPLLDYWFTAEKSFLEGMGVDVSKMPPREQFGNMLRAQIEAGYRDKKAYALIWLLDGVPVGHSNINPVVFGDHAWMHLHMWNSNNRKQGLGEKYIRLCLPYYFGNFDLRELYCEPYALNPAPHKVVESVGFEFEKEYITIPGSINFEQPVKRWVMSRERFESLKL